MSEKHNFDGRLLEIIDESTASDEAKVITKQVLLDFYKNNSVAQLIRNLKVRMIDFEVNKTNILEILKDLTRGIPTYYMSIEDEIHTYPNLIDYYFKNQGKNLKTEEEVSEALGSTFLHESVHKIQFTISKHAKIMMEQGSRMFKSAATLLSNSQITRSNHDNIITIRIVLFFYFRNIQVEGVARFIQDEARGKLPYQESMFESLYVKALEKAKELSKLFLEVLELWDLKKRGKKRNKNPKVELDKLIDMGRDTYDVGLHMAYTIMYFNQNMKLTTILKLSPLSFIKRYEASIKRHGVEPIVSLTSKKGTVDYSEMASHLNEGVKKLIKRNK